MSVSQQHAAQEFRLCAEEAAVLETQIDGEQYHRALALYAGLPSRHIRHPSNAAAVTMLVNDLRQIGGKRFTVSTHSFYHEGRWFDNVEAVMRGSGREGAVIVAAHLDSTASGEPAYQPTEDEAPGADDNASGIVGVLLAARALVHLAQIGTKPRRNIRFVFFNAEEAQQRGSEAYISGASGITAALVMDMIGYDPHRRRLFEIHAGFSEGNGVQTCVQRESLKIAGLIADLASQVSNEMTTEIYPDMNVTGDQDDPADGFGDHTSFHQAGVAACQVSHDFFDSPDGERLGEPNLHYHTREDTAADLNEDYGAGIARAVAAAAWYIATHDWPPACATVSSEGPSRQSTSSGGENGAAHTHT